MRIRITLVGDYGNCSTIKECSQEQYDFLESILDTMGDEIEEDYCPDLYIEKVDE